ncbi:hypothetical protein GCM10027451_02470 [Geodermatophilus aquaeductus]
MESGRSVSAASVLRSCTRVYGRAGPDLEANAALFSVGVPRPGCSRTGARRTGVTGGAPGGVSRERGGRRRDAAGIVERPGGDVRNRTPLTLSPPARPAPPPGPATQRSRGAR